MQFMPLTATTSSQYCECALRRQ